LKHSGLWFVPVLLGRSATVNRAVVAASEAGSRHQSCSSRPGPVMAASTIQIRFRGAHATTHLITGRRTMVTHLFHEFSEDEQGTTRHKSSASGRSTDW
jgi:hypothetical protein